MKSFGSQEFRVIRPFLSVLQFSLRSTTQSVSVLNVSWATAVSQLRFPGHTQHHWPKTGSPKPSLKTTGLSEGSSLCQPMALIFAFSFPKRGCSLMYWVCTSMRMWTNGKVACRPSYGSDGGSDASSAVTKSLLSERRNRNSAVAGWYSAIWVTSGTRWERQQTPWPGQNLL